MKDTNAYQPKFGERCRVYWNGGGYNDITFLRMGKDKFRYQINEEIHTATLDKVHKFFETKHNLIEKLQARIKELESDKHINEIKAQGICWALELASFDCTVHDDPVSVLEKVEKYAEQLRNNNEKNT